MTTPDAISPAKHHNEVVSGAPRRFEFARDTFAFANELHWAYRFDPATAKTTFSRRVPSPHYAHRCFVLVRSARQFLYHARFDPARSPASDNHYRHLIRQVVSRNPRKPCPPDQCLVIPGFASLWKFSVAREQLLKFECGGAWRSYILRSHWRMVFPISRAHQARTAAALNTAIHQGGSPTIHLVRFPNLSINHGMVLFNFEETASAIRFAAYDPNLPGRPSELTFDRAQRTFFLPRNHYWAGGRADVVEVYRGWFY